MSEKTLILTIGLPRSGKSTWAREQGHPIVSPDAIRLGLHGDAWNPLSEGFVWAIAKVMVRALFIAGHDTVILDSTNNTVHRRTEWKSKSWKRGYEIFFTPKDICLERAVATDQEHLVPVIEKMASEHESLDKADIDA